MHELTVSIWRYGRSSGSLDGPITVTACRQQVARAPFVVVGRYHHGIMLEMLEVDFLAPAGAGYRARWPGICSHATI